MRFEIIPEESEFGFDGRSTLHGFTGRTRAVEGEFVFRPESPDDAPYAVVTARAATLDTGKKRRDRDMRRHLAVEKHPLIRFELTAFELEARDGKAYSGTAHGRLTIRGVTRDVDVPIKLFLEGEELTVEGRASLRLSDYEVPIPRVLGFIKVADAVQIWFRLRARRTRARRRKPRDTRARRRSSVPAGVVLIPRSP